MSDAAPPHAKPASRRGLRLAATLAGAGALLAGSLAGGLWWGLATASGSAWLLRQLPGLQQLDAPSGALLGDFSARRLVWSSGDWRIDAQQLRWQGLSLSRSAAPGAWAQIDVQGLQAARLEIAFPSSATDLPTPQDLSLPVGLKIDSLRIAELALPALGRDAAPLRGVDASLALGDAQGRTHRLQLRHLEWEHWQLQGALNQDAGVALRTQASLQAQRSDAATGKDWRASVTLDGPLPAPQLQARIEAQGQGLELQSELAPLAAWPIRKAAASAQAFDLAALTPRLPATALQGQVQLDFAGWQQPAQLKAQLDNARAGRWDQGRLPLRRLTLDLSARPDQLGHWREHTRVDALELLLGSAAEPGGRISAKGTLQSLHAQIAELRPTALDSRLPRLQLGGSLALQDQPSAGDNKNADTLQLDGALNGQWQMPRGAQPVRLALQAQSDLARTLTLQRLQLASGEASLHAQAQLSRGDDGRWQAELGAQAQRLDPRLLWGGRDGGAWQRGRHEINASLQASLTPPAGTAPWPGGEARLQLLPSQLNGMPLAGELSYRADAARTAAPPQLQGEFTAAGNQLALRAGADGQATLELRADALAGLQPLLALWQPQARIAGAARLRAELSPAATQQPSLAGDWQLALKGSADKLVLDSLSLGALSVDARAGTLRDAPLQLDVQARQLLVSGARLSQATLGLSGSWARHQLKLDAKGAVALPAWLATLAGSDSSHAPLSAAAQWDGEFAESPWRMLRAGNKAAAPPAAPLQWQARAGSLQLRPDKPGLPAWLDAEGLALNVSVDLRQPASPLQRLALAAGRAELAGARVRWRELLWQPPVSGGALPELSADLELEPLAVAPLLARWQPDFGWGGDLVMGGQLRLRSSPATQVDIVLQRTAGDLSVTDDSGVHALGLSELRLALLAQDGRWHLTQAIAGEQLGAIGGAFTALTSPQAAWPGPDASLEGVLTAHVANLGDWGAWVPPGWRLGGRLDAGISLAGKLGAPEIKGQASGEQIAVRNPLLGVDVDQGHFTLALDGATATLKELGARGGDGTLSAEGAVELGETPLARLSVQAQRFRLLNRVDRRLVVSGNGTLELGRQTLALDGRFAFDEGLFDFSRADAPALDEDVRVQRPHAPAQAAPAARRASERRISMKLALDFGEKLRVFGRGLDTHLRGELLLGHAQGRPQLNGTLRAVGGTYEAYGQRLEIEKGELVFIGPLDNPRLDVLAVRPNTDEVKAGVTLTGTALNPRVKLYSEPELSEAEKIAWLVLGRGPDTLGRSDTLLVQRAALALLAGEGGGTTGKLMKNLGLDEVSVGQDVDETRGTVVRVGKQISKRVYLGYERSLNATTGSWQLIYRIAQRFTLRAQSGEQNAMDLIWQWQWR